MNVKTIGTVESSDDGFAIKVKPEYSKGLQGLEDCGALHILWWADQSYAPDYEDGIVLEKPYVHGPKKIGVFATRSQFRPNGICSSTIFVKSVDCDKGIIYTYYIDAVVGTEVLDIKPYVAASDKVGKDVSPVWCAHWPKTIEESGSFDWEAEFNF